MPPASRERARRRGGPPAVPSSRAGLAAGRVPPKHTHTHIPSARHARVRVYSREDAGPRHPGQRRWRPLGRGREPHGRPLAADDSRLPRCPGARPLGAGPTGGARSPEPGCAPGNRRRFLLRGLSGALGRRQRRRGGASARGGSCSRSASLGLPCPAQEPRGSARLTAPSSLPAAFPPRPPGRAPAPGRGLEEGPAPAAASATPGLALS